MEFRGRSPLAHTCACRRLAGLISGTVARLAPGSGRLTLGRAGFAPAGRRTKLHEGIASSNPIRPAGPGRTSALHVRPFPVCLLYMLCIFNGLGSGICLRALLGYHSPYRSMPLLSLPTCSPARYWPQSKTYRPDSRPRRSGAAGPPPGAPGARAAERR
jgi:hypothetical protein